MNEWTGVIRLGMCVLRSASKNVEWLLSISSSADGLGLGLRDTFSRTCPRFTGKVVS
jgi:hypothetical protein